MNQLPAPEKALFTLLEQYIDEDIIVAFSGGVDSTLLLRVAHLVAARKNHTVHAVTFRTTLHPAGDLALTSRLAGEMGVEHRVIVVDEMQHAGIQHNPTNRCYLCKKYLFSELRLLAEKMGVSKIFDGTNADDLLSHRPGIQALRELRIISPLAQAGMTKDDIRKLALHYNLETAERPSSPCLATRFPYGTELNPEMINRVEKGEEYLHELGFYNVRIRVHANIARIELDSSELMKALEFREEIASYLRTIGYTYITMDLEGFRSGSMDIGMEPD